MYPTLVIFIVTSHRSVLERFEPQTGLHDQHSISWPITRPTRLRTHLGRTGVGGDVTRWDALGAGTDAERGDVFSTATSNTSESSVAYNDSKFVAGIEHSTLLDHGAISLPGRPQFAHR